MNERLSSEEAYRNHQAGLAMHMYEDVRYADPPEKECSIFLKTYIRQGQKRKTGILRLSGSLHLKSSPESSRRAAGEQPEMSKEYYDVLEKLERPDD
jgi:hypothetical protein